MGVELEKRISVNNGKVENHKGMGAFWENVRLIIMYYGENFKAYDMLFNGSAGKEKEIW